MSAFSSRSLKESLLRNEEKRGKWRKDDPVIHRHVVRKKSAWRRKGNSFRGNAGISLSSYNPKALLCWPAAIYRDMTFFSSLVACWFLEDRENAAPRLHVGRDTSSLIVYICERKLCIFTRYQRDSVDLSCILDKYKIRLCCDKICPVLAFCVLFQKNRR